MTSHDAIFRITGTVLSGGTVQFLRSLLFVSCVFMVVRPVGGQVAPAPPPVTFRVSGLVADGGRNAIDKADVTLVSEKGVTLAGATSGPDGQFSLGEFSAGNATVRVRRLGYEQFEMKITIGQGDKPTFVETLLRELPQKLEEVLVKSDEEGRLREFYQHKKQRNNFGRFFDRADIRIRNPSLASELLRTVPGMQVQTSEFGGNSVRVRGCKPLVWVDGQRIPGAELDDVARPADIAGLEVYPSNAGIPAEYMDRNNGVCGIIVVWTKSQ